MNFFITDIEELGMLGGVDVFLIIASLTSSGQGFSCFKGFSCIADKGITAVAGTADRNLSTIIVDKFDFCIWE